MLCLIKKYGAPVITNDGVTIAKEIDLEDPFENMGAQLVKKRLQKQTMLRETERQRDGSWLMRLLRKGFANVAAQAQIRW